jgi:hypothetical protein
VQLGAERITVAPDAVVTAPNLYGPAVVWPYYDTYGHVQVRCFLPGELS